MGSLGAYRKSGRWLSCHRACLRVCRSEYQLSGVLITVALWSSSPAISLGPMYASKANHNRIEVWLDRSCVSRTNMESTPVYLSHCTAHLCPRRPSRKKANRSPKCAATSTSSATAGSITFRTCTYGAPCQLCLARIISFGLGLGRCLVSQGRDVRFTGGVSMTIGLDRVGVTILEANWGEQSRWSGEEGTAKADPAARVIGMVSRTGGDKDDGNSGCCHMVTS